MAEKRRGCVVSGWIWIYPSPCSAYGWIDETHSYMRVDELFDEDCLAKEASRGNSVHVV